MNRVWQAYFGTGWWRRPKTSARRASRRRIPNCSIGWPSSSWTTAGASSTARLIVTSATYRQSVAVTPELLARDPDNRLLARGPRFRVDAEVVRDIALAASGLLNPKVGGPSVYPPAPEFLFKPPASYGPKTWADDTGPDRYRRGTLHVPLPLACRIPLLQNFDAPNGEIACVRRSRSNTPLQALTTLNEPLFLEVRPRAGR